MTDVTGLINSNVRIQFAGAKLSGYTTGVTNIHNCTAKFTKIVRSLYFVVRLEIIIPRPIAIRPSCTKTMGRIIQAAQFGETSP